MTTGIVIGKFYPPHRGHNFLIETAEQSTDHLVVAVCDRKDQSIPGELRASWLRRLHPEAEVIVVEDILKDDDSGAWAEYTLQFLGYAPDFVFTSENYGEAYASLMGSKHILVDIDRKTFPVSGTQIRDNPLKYWEYISPCVRAYYAVRFCVVGAESTGTTTLAQDLAKHFNTSWVPEFGRFYWEGKMFTPDASTWQTPEFLFIARQQNRFEDAMAETCNRLLFCDTDSFATSLWHERYVGSMSSEVDEISSDRKYALYFLTDVDIPFFQDGTRDGEHIRHNMHRRFIEELEKRGKKFIIVSGSREERLDRAVKECNIFTSRFD